METPEEYQQRVIRELIDEEKIIIRRIFRIWKKWKRIKFLVAMVNDMKQKTPLDILIDKTKNNKEKQQLMNLRNIHQSKVDELSKLQQAYARFRKSILSDAEISSLKEEIRENQQKKKKAKAAKRNSKVKTYAINILRIRSKLEHDKRYKGFIVEIEEKIEELEDLTKRIFSDAFHMSDVIWKTKAIEEISGYIKTSPNISSFLNDIYEREREEEEMVYETTESMFADDTDDDLTSPIRVQLNNIIDEDDDTEV